MIVISYGVRKSGTTLAFELARAVLELNGYPQARLPEPLLGRSKPYNAVDSWTEERLHRLVDATAGNIVVVKTHASCVAISTPTMLGLLASGQVKIQTVFRDPRDTVLSLLDEARRKPAKDKARTVEEAIVRMRPRLDELRRWCVFPTLRLFYEQYAFDRSAGPRLIADDFGMLVDPHEVWRRTATRNTRKNVARPHRHRCDMSRADAQLVEAAFPEFLALIERGDPAWFGAIG